MFDSHTHIQFPAYDKNREDVIKRAQAAGVKMICVGTQYGTSRAAIELAEKHPKDIWASIGFHPNHVVVGPETNVGGQSHNWHHDKKEQKDSQPEIFDVEKFRKLASHPKVVAIGECGLDYYRLNVRDVGSDRNVRNDVSEIKENQKKIFLEQVRLARDFNKALMIHCRPSKGTDDAYEDLLQIFQKNISDTSNNSNTSNTSNVLHFYVGSLPITKKLVEAGFYFTFGGVITFSNDYDEIIKYIPLDRILLETDAPYVAPEPYRGKQNEPSYVIETTKKMAEIKGISYQEVTHQTSINACKVFNIVV